MKENWIETSVKYDKAMEDGTTKSVTEKYLVSALSFTEAETNITEEMKHYISGDFSVAAVRTARYVEVYTLKILRLIVGIKCRLHLLCLTIIRAKKSVLL
mgnify:CR=1 FL=1